MLHIITYQGDANQNSYEMIPQNSETATCGEKGTVIQC